MTNITLNGTAAVQIQQGTAAGFSLQNNGPGNVYLANDASVSPSTGYVVQPGVSLPLNANAVLYGCTDNGQTAAIQLLQGATATQATIVEANVPNAVNVSGSVEITNATVPVSGNVNITNASIPVSGNVNVAGGSVSVTGSAVSVSGNVGTSAQNAPTLIDTIALTVPAGLQTGFSLINKTYSTVGYASMFMVISGGATGGTINANAFINGTISQYIGGSAPNAVASYNPEWLFDAGMNDSIQLPVLGDSITFNFGGTKPAGSPAEPLTIRIYGSSQLIDRAKYVSASGQQNGSLPYGGYYMKSAPNPTNVTEFVGSKNGLAVLNIYGLGSTGFMVLNVATGGSVKGIAALYTSATTPIVNGSYQDIQLPMLPILVQSESSAGSPTISITQ